MQAEAALTAITNNLELFTTEKLSRLEQSKLKAMRLPGRIAYFKGGSLIHRVAIVCPLEDGVSHQQLLVGGLIWANKIANGQRTTLYLVGEGFSSTLSLMTKAFGPQIEVRLAYYTPKLANPFLIPGRDARVVPPRYSLPAIKDKMFWARKFNPVDRKGFLAALGYFTGFANQGVNISFLMNKVSVRFKGLEVVHINKKEARLRITLVTRYPREVPGMICGRTEREGWVNAEGLLNSEFRQAFEARIDQLNRDRELFARVCPEKHHLESLVCNELPALGVTNTFSQLDVGFKGETALIVDMLGNTADKKLIVASVHVAKDLQGLMRCYEQQVWAGVMFAEINRAYFANCLNGLIEVWLFCPENKVHAELEALRMLTGAQQRIKLVTVNKDWAETGIRSLPT
ncbi:MAG TPA: hypothetical protein VHQ46_05200 [Desulfobacteria bacterium]|nr:hypothetical protein [Desulfobacteria bacterium]